MRSFAACVLLLLVSSASVAISWDPLKLVGAGKPPGTVSELNLSQYTGRWYQMYGNRFVFSTFEKDGTCITADYAIEGDKIAVFNAQNLKTPGGTLDTINGTATIKDQDQPGKLSVTFSDVPFSFGVPYWVLELGPVINDQYQYSIVSDPIRLSLFVLARDTTDFEAKYGAEVRFFLEENGFTWWLNKPIAVEHTSECVYAPLEKIKDIASSDKFDLARLLTKIV